MEEKNGTSPPNGENEVEKHVDEKASSTQNDLQDAQRANSKEDFAPPSDFIYPTPKEEAAVIRKLDWRLMPIVFFLYMLSVLDRANLGNAKLAGMAEDIDLSGFRYNWLGTIFYIAYILSQWLLIGWKHFKPHIWCAAVVLFWGFVSSIQAAANSWGGLMACRFFLGVAEAAYGPGVPLYLTYFYPREKVGFRHGIFIAAAALANAYGGALAYGISQINGSLAPWRILFLIEGLPTCVFALIPFFFLPDSIAQTTFLNERETQIAYHFVARNQRIDVEKNQGIRFKEMFDGLKDPKSFLPGLMYFSCNVCFASLPLFVPTIILGLGTFDEIQSNGLSAPPYLACFFYIIGITWLSDHFKMRGPFCALSGLISGIGFIINASTTTTASRYFSVFLSVQIFASVALLLAWVANIHATESRRAGGYTVLATLGQCGPVLGTNIYPDTDAPLFRTGLWVSGAFCLLVFVCSIILSLWLHWENKKLDKEGVAQVQEFEDTSIAHAQESGQARHRYII